VIFDSRDPMSLQTWVALRPEPHALQLQALSALPLYREMREAILQALEISETGSSCDCPGPPTS